MFEVKLYRPRGKWSFESEFKTYEEARKRCIELVKKRTEDKNYYSEPSSDLVGKIGKCKNEAFFGDTVEDHNWTCMIEIA